MTGQNFSRWKNIAQAAFTDAATLPFRFPRATYDFKKAIGETENTAKIAKTGATVMLAAGTVMTALGAAIGLGIPAGIIAGLAFPYMTAFASAGILCTARTSPSEHDATLKALWPRTMKTI